MASASRRVKEGKKAAGGCGCGGGDGAVPGPVSQTPPYNLLVRYFRTASSGKREPAMISRQSQHEQVRAEAIKRTLPACWSLRSELRPAVPPFFCPIPILRSLLLPSCHCRRFSKERNVNKLYCQPILTQREGEREYICDSREGEVSSSGERSQDCLTWQT